MNLIQVPNRIKRYLLRHLHRYQLNKTGVQFGSNLLLNGMPIVSLAKSSSIRLGDRVVLTSECKHTALGVNHPIVLRTLKENACIIIGNDVGISGGSICAACKVVIGDRTMLGANVTIADTDFHPISIEDRRYTSEKSIIHTSEIHIGENVFIGAGTYILKGVNIGNNAVIGAGSIVTRDIPANVVAAGNPCHIIRPIKQAA